MLSAHDRHDKCSDRRLLLDDGEVMRRNKLLSTPHFSHSSLPDSVVSGID